MYEKIKFDKKKKISILIKKVRKKFYFFQTK